MRQLWIFLFLAGMGIAISPGQQIPPPPPPPTQAQAPQSVQPAQQPAPQPGQTTPPAAQPGQVVQQPPPTTAPAVPAVPGQQPGMTQPTQTVQQPSQPLQPPPAETTVPAAQPGQVMQQPPPTTAPPAVPAQQPEMAQPAQTMQQPTQPAQQPAQVTGPAAQPGQTVQQTPPTAPPAAPAQQPGMTQPAQTTQQPAPAQPVQQPAQPTVPTTPQMPSAQVEQQLHTRAQESVRQANEQYQLEVEAARQEAIIQAEEDARKAQAKADKAREEAQKNQAKANEANAKAQSLKGGAPLPQSDRPEMTEAEYAREYLRDREKALGRLNASYEVMKEFTTSKVRISGDLIKSAKCVVIIPATKRAAFVVGANYGRGVMTCRLGEAYNGPWSAPTMVALEGGSFGFQIGIQGTDWVLLIMNDRGVNSLLSTKGKLGVDVALAAGPWGRNAQASTDLAMRTEILSFGNTHGIYLGASLDGSSLRPDHDGNTSLYGRRLNPRDIVRSGEIRIPVEAVPLTNYLFQVSTAVVDVPEAPGKEDSK